MLNYLEDVKGDVLEAIEDLNGYQINLEEIAANDEWDDLESDLNDRFWDDDSITGNGSGSYYFNREEAKEKVLANMETVIEAYREFGCDIGDDLQNDDWEKIDVTARCYVLGWAISEAIEEIQEQYNA